MAKSKAEKDALKKAKAEFEAQKKKKRFEFPEESHTAINKSMKHKDFPEFLKTNFEEAGEKINK